MVEEIMRGLRVWISLWLSRNGEGQDGDRHRDQRIDDKEQRLSDLEQRTKRLEEMVEAKQRRA
jgi:hypothetical protein